MTAPETRPQTNDPFLSLALEVAQLCFFELDIATRQLTRSVGAERFWRIPAAYTGDKDRFVWELVHPADRERLGQFNARVLQQRETLETEFRIVHAEGTVRWVRVRARAVYNDQGAPVRIVGVNMDITDQKRLEDEHEVALAKYRTLFETFPLGITICDQHGQIVEANPIAEQILGLSAEAQKQRTIDGALWSIVRPDGSPMPPEEYASTRALRDGRTVANVEMGIVKSPSETTWINVTATPLPLPGYGVAITYSDISDRLKAMQALQASEAKLRSYFENVADNLTVNTSDGRIIDANRRVCATLGYTRDQLLGMSALSIDAGIDDAQLREIVEGVRPDTTTIMERSLRRKDGTLLPVELRISSFMDGAERRFIVQARDITDRKQAEAKAAHMTKLLREAEQIAHLGCFEYDVATQATVWSQEEYNIYGLDPQGPSPTYEIMLTRCVHPDDAADMNRVFLEAMARNSVYEHEHRIVRPNGTERWTHNLAQPFFDESGKLVRYVGTTLDITERRQAAQRLEQSREQLRELLARMSQVQVQERTRISRDIHDELGQLLTALKMDVRWLERKITEADLSAARPTLLDRVVATSEVVDAAIAAVQKVAADLRPSALEYLGFSAAVEEEVRRFERRAECACVVTIEQPWQDPRREIAECLLDIIQEALTNVSRHAQATRVEVVLRRTDGHWTIEVKDDGIGCEEAKLVSRHALGLLGMRERAYQYGGEVSFARNQPRGTTVRVRLPATTGDAPGANPPSP